MFAQHLSEMWMRDSALLSVTDVHASLCIAALLILVTLAVDAFNDCCCVMIARYSEK